MGKQDLRAKSISELRAMAKKAGVKAKAGWAKDDYIKALSKGKAAKAAPKKSTAKKPALKKTKKQAKSVPVEKKKASPKVPVAKAAKKPVPLKPVAKKPAPEKSAKKSRPLPKPAKKPAQKASAKSPVKPAPKSREQLRKAKDIKPAIKTPARKAPGKEAAKPLELLTIAELRALAKELKITPAGGQRKADIIAAISKTRVKDTEPPAPAAEVKSPVAKPVPEAMIAKREKVTSPGPRKNSKAAALAPLSKSEHVLPKATEAMVKELKKSPVQEPATPAGVIKKPKGPVPAELPAPSAAETTTKDDEQKMAATPSLAECDRNKIVSMPVTPRRIYVYWQISEDMIAGYKGSLNLKVLDLKTNAFFYVPISERIGEHFIEVSPDAEYAIEAGTINYNGEFINMALLAHAKAAAPASVPEKPEVPDEGTLPEEFFETPESVSSY